MCGLSDAEKENCRRNLSNKLKHLKRIYKQNKGMKKKTVVVCYENAPCRWGLWIRGVEWVVGYFFSLWKFFLVIGLRKLKLDRCEKLCLVLYPLPFRSSAVYRLFWPGGSKLHWNRTIQVPLPMTIHWKYVESTCREYCWHTIPIIQFTLI